MKDKFPAKKNSKFQSHLNYKTFVPFAYFCYPVPDLDNTWNSTYDECCTSAVWSVFWGLVWPVVKGQNVQHVEIPRMSNSAVLSEPVASELYKVPFRVGADAMGLKFIQTNVILPVQTHWLHIGMGFKQPTRKWDFKWNIYSMYDSLTEQKRRWSI